MNGLLVAFFVFLRNKVPRLSNAFRILEVEDEPVHGPWGHVEKSCRFRHSVEGQVPFRFPPGHAERFGHSFSQSDPVGLGSRPELYCLGLAGVPIEDSSIESAQERLSFRQAVRLFRLRGDSPRVDADMALLYPEEVPSGECCIFTERIDPLGDPAIPKPRIEFLQVFRGQFFF